MVFILIEFGEDFLQHGRYVVLGKGPNFIEKAGRTKIVASIHIIDYFYYNFKRPLMLFIFVCLQISK